MRAVRTGLLFVLAVAGPAPVAQDSGTITVGGESYAVPADLAAAGIAEMYPVAERLEPSPSGHFAIAVYADNTRDDATGEELTSYGLLVLDRKEKRVIRELTAWRQATSPGEWDKEDVYHFYGGSPDADRGDTEYQYDAKSNKVVGYE